MDDRNIVELPCGWKALVKDDSVLVFMPNVKISENPGTWTVGMDGGRRDGIESLKESLRAAARFVISKDEGYKSYAMSVFEATLDGLEKTQGMLKDHTVIEGPIKASVWMKEGKVYMVVHSIPESIRGKSGRTNPIVSLPMKVASSSLPALDYDVVWLPGHDRSADNRVVEINKPTSGYDYYCKVVQSLNNANIAILGADTTDPVIGNLFGICSRLERRILLLEAEFSRQNKK